MRQAPSRSDEHVGGGQIAPAVTAGPPLSEVPISGPGGEGASAGLRRSVAAEVFGFCVAAG